MSAIIVDHNARRHREGVRFAMRGGPYDGLMLRVFGSDWSGLHLPEHGGTYFMGEGVDPHMPAKKPNKKLTNVPFMEWHEG